MSDPKQPGKAYGCEWEIQLLWKALNHMRADIAENGERTSRALIVSYFAAGYVLMDILFKLIKLVG